MAQIVGRKLPQAGIVNQNYSQISAEATDANGNIGLHTMIFGNPLGGAVYTVGDYLYAGDCGTPGAAEGDACWRVTRQYTDPGTGDIKITHAYVPANVYKGSFANEAAIIAAHAVGEPGWNAYNEDTSTYWVWDPFAGPAAWVDTASAVAIVDSEALYAGFDHIMTSYATLNYCF